MVTAINKTIEITAIIMIMILVSFLSALVMIGLAIVINFVEKFCYYWIMPIFYLSLFGGSLLFLLLIFLVLPISVLLNNRVNYKTNEKGQKTTIKNKDDLNLRVNVTTNDMNFTVYFENGEVCSVASSVETIGRWAYEMEFKGKRISNIKDDNEHVIWPRKHVPRIIT